MNCSIDDSANCCGICEMRPTVLIATHDRIEITTRNIELLKQQTKRPEIVVVATEKKERWHYQNLGVTVIDAPNSPLGRKWQAGVKEDSNPLIICGSDDILAPDYVEKVCKLVRDGYDLIGVTAWYVYDQVRKDLWLAGYINKCMDFPLGAGKAISGQLLKRMKYSVFNPVLSKNLDSMSYDNAVRLGAKIKLIRTPEVLSIKGQWHTLNPLEKLKVGKNIHMTSVEIENMIKFNYFNTDWSLFENKIDVAKKIL